MGILSAIDPGMLGSLIGAAGRGYDYQQDRDQAQQAYQDQRARLQAKDARDAKLFEDEQEQTQYNKGRRGIREAMDQAGLTSAQAHAAIEQNAADRIPTTNDQADARFELQQEQGHHAMDNQDKQLEIARQHLGIAAANAADMHKQHEYQMKLNDIGWQHAQAQEAADQAMMHAAPIVQDAFSSNDKAANFAKQFGYDGASVDPKTGALSVVKGGKTVTFANPEAAMQELSTHITPYAMVNHVHALTQAQQQGMMEASRHPQQYFEDASGNLVKPVPGSNQTVPILDPSGKPMRGTLAGHYRQDLGDPTMTGQPVSAQPQAGGIVAATSQPQAAPQPQQRRVVQTGIDTVGQYGPKGGRVAKYDDGSIAPLQ